MSKNLINIRQNEYFYPNGNAANCFLVDTLNSLGQIVSINIVKCEETFTFYGVQRAQLWAAG